MRGTPSLDTSSYLTSLCQSKQSLIHEENFTQAKLLAAKISQVKEKERAEAVKQLRTKHKHNLAVVTTTVEQEVARFNESWDSYMQAFFEQLRLKEEQLKKEHQEALGRQRTLFEQQSARKPSGHLLQLINSKQTAARLECFSAAERLRREIKLRRKQERQAYQDKYSEQIQCRLERFEIKQQRERALLKHRHERLIEEMAKLRKVEHDKMMMKFCTIRRELQGTQRLELTQARGRTNRSFNGSISPSSTTKRYIKRLRSTRPGVY